MEGRICVTRSDRKRLLKLCRYGDNVRVARYAHVILLRSDGWTWADIRDALFCSNDLIGATIKIYQEHGVEGLSRSSSSSVPSVVPAWLVFVIRWLTKHSPQDFSYFRTRWTCSLLSELLWWEQGIRVGREAIRRALRNSGYVWRRPRPIVGPKDPEYDKKNGSSRNEVRDVKLICWQGFTNGGQLGLMSSV